MRLKTSSSLLLMLVLATLSSVMASATDHLVRHNLRTPRASDNHTVGGSPLRSLININDVLNSITVEFIDSVVLRDVSAPDTFHCLEDEIAVGLYANSTTNNILYSMTVLNVTVSDAQDVLHNYIKHNEMNVLQGIVPSSVLDLNGFLLIDPIYPYNRVRWEDPNVIYFYPTLEQQFYVFSNYFASSSSASGATPQDIYAVINAETPKENVLVAAALERAMSNFGLSFDYQLTAASVVDFLKPDCVNIVVGITSADILPLQTFLRDNLRAIVVVTFDDLTIQYTEVRALGIKDFDVMERILFATNLPLWTHRATTYEVAMIVFFEHFRRPYHTPAAVRAYFSMLMLDQLTSHTRTTSSIRKAIYDNTEMAVDSTTMGDFTDVCPFPTQQPLSCLVNFGAQNIRIWTYGGVHRIDSVPLFGPTTPPVSFFTQSDDLRMLATEPRLAIVSVISGIIWAMVIFLIVLAYLCAMGYLDDVHAVVSILHVSVEHVNQGNGVSIFRIQEVLQRYADVVDSLVEKHHAMQVGSHPKNFVLAARKADDALALARDLIATVNQLQPQLPMGATVGLRIGIHTDSCSCAQALDENDLDRLAVAAAPLTMLAQCVGELCSANEILLTGWTYAQLGENPIRQTCKLHSRNTLDDETVVIEVYRYSPQVNEAMERLLREEFSLLSLTSVEESKRLASMATVRPPTTDETHIMESSHNVSNRLNALGMILMADESSDEMSSRLIHYDL